MLKFLNLFLSEETIDGTFVQFLIKQNLQNLLVLTDSIITVDSTIGWAERNGEFLIGVVQNFNIKKSLLTSLSNVLVL